MADPLILRPYQHQLKVDVQTAWQWHQNVLAVLPTGGGKTVIFSDIIKNVMCNQPSVAIAHRSEIVNQIAMSLALNQVPHRVIGPKSLTRTIVRSQMSELGTTFYSPNAPCAVAGVDTLIRRGDELSAWMSQVMLWVIDEAHHLLTSNKWGTAVNMFPNAKGLGVTATPVRADGKGLGRHTDGVFDALVEGPGMRDLITDGWLTDYRIFAPPSDLDISQVNITKSGEFNPEKLKRAVRTSHIVGDVVEHYLRIARGKLGITFATDVDTATDIAAQFNAKGVPSEVVSAKTPDAYRADIIKRFRNREIMQLVNVDLFGEGFDLPAIEVCSMARPTQSYGLYCQQFGRALRTMAGKDIAIIIDHVGNVVRHGLPDTPRDWSLDARERKPKAKKLEDDIPLRYCVSCTQPYERYLVQCPYCHHKFEPAGRTKPEFVDGDLHELDADTLAEMRGQVDKVSNYDATVNAMKRSGAPGVAVNSFRKNAMKRLEMQEALRESMSHWAGQQRLLGRSDSEIYKLFYFTFGTDVLTAQAMNRQDALNMANQINERLTN